MGTINTYTRGKMLYLDIRQYAKRDRLASGVKDSKEARDFFKKNGALILENRANIKSVAEQYLKYENYLIHEKLLKEEKALQNEKKAFSLELEGEFTDFFNSLLITKRGTLSNLNSLKMFISLFFKSENLKSVRDFKKGHIPRFIMYCEKKNLRNSTIKMRFNFLKRFINFYIDEGMREPIAIKLPRLKLDQRDLESRQKDALSYAEISLFVKNAPSPLREYLTVAFFTGARTGEILGLKKSDIDFKKKEIHIRRTRISKHHTNSPKNEFSYRTIDMLNIVEKSLKIALEGKKEDDFIFEKGRDFYVRLFKKLLAKLNARPMKLYETRHCFASLMLSRNEDIEWISRRMLGHANSAMTYAKYARIIQKDVSQRANFIMEEDF